MPVHRFDHLRVPLLQSRGQRTVRDEELQAEVSRVHTENYSVYGAHKVWLEMRSEGIDAARCTIDGCLRARMRTKRHGQPSAPPSPIHKDIARTIWCSEVQPCDAKNVVGERFKCSATRPERSEYS
ncbi:IS3 family transposase [Rhodococcus qingshengii]|uniref:IS3 family transposase n=1 Tax=Rhodococcus qingshengii TaxID=334542 RepID=UPI0036F3DF2D